MTPRRMIIDWLTAHGYDGLVTPDGDCSCTTEDLGHCRSVDLYCCVPGRLRPRLVDGNWWDKAVMVPDGPGEG